MFDSITELHRYISLYCTQLFEKMDHELVPEVLLDVVTEEAIPKSPQYK